MMRSVHKLAMLAVLVSFNAVWAAGPSTTQILACMKITENTQRLTCFDREAAVLSDAPPEVKLTPEQKIGLPRAKVEALEAPPNAPAQIRTFVAAIKSVTVDGAARQVFTLDNGQVWRQDQSEQYFRTHPGDAVRIRKGTLGSFFLELQTNSHLSIRVSRVR
jgi:hypothetical protein